MNATTLHYSADILTHKISGEKWRTITFSGSTDARETHSILNCFFSTLAGHGINEMALGSLHLPNTTESTVSTLPALCMDI